MSLQILSGEDLATIRIPSARRFTQKPKENTNGIDDIKILNIPSPIRHISLIDQTDSNEIIDNINLLNINKNSSPLSTNDNKSNVQLKITTNDVFINHHFHSMIDNNDLHNLATTQINRLSPNYQFQNDNIVSNSDLLVDTNQIQDENNLLNNNGVYIDDKVPLNLTLSGNYFYKTGINTKIILFDLDNDSICNDHKLVNYIYELKSEREKYNNYFDKQIKEINNKLQKLITDKNTKNEELTNKINECMRSIKNKKLYSKALHRKQLKRINNNCINKNNRSNDHKQ
ncbi:unnamed protein product [Adineta steineri]|uniref:Uncharacterized protein n=1 Tax=Adineta steineri TaxID=433720 RepID=A0A815AYG6_9BILA|nr:unnamed protein product [Adineta steineri]CAF1593084.1 unnamed protein product [Adineta steineri]